MAGIESGTRENVRRTVYEFFSDECEVPMHTLHDSTNVIRDLEGDSLMMAELMEVFRKKYRMNIELKTVSAFVARHPAETIGAIIDVLMLIIEHGNRIADID